MGSRWLVALVGAAAVCCASWVLAGEGSGKKSEKAGPVLTCPVSGKPASKTASVDYHGGKILLCCEGCRAKFEKETAKYATKANLQLVATGQAKQVACPISGRPTNPDVLVKVAGVDVGLCCNHCKAKLTKAKGDQQVELAFGAKAFEKAFKVQAKKKEQGS